MGAIVVGFIDSSEGQAAMERAIAEARLRQGKLVIVHSMVGGPRESGEEYIASAEALDRVRQRLTSEGLDFSVHEYVRGQTAAQDVVQAAREYEAELVVIGIRRRTAAGKLLLGSTALDILHDADAPVLCVKAAER